MVAHRLDVGPRADAVPAARRFTASALRPTGSRQVVEAAELVVTELLTNALLHGTPPVRLVVCTAASAHSARIEVHDGSRALPVRALEGGGMTGRGLALVDALAADWGVQATADGKVIWAELTTGSVEVAEPADVDLDRLLAGSWHDEAGTGPQRYSVTLGDVPTDLLLAAKAHVDSVVRELTLTAGGAESGLTAAVPAALPALVHDVVSEFAEARQAIKRQALAAAGRGQRRPSLTLTLPAEAADAGLRYLAALEEADAYGRSARLLTLEAPAQHRAFRRWYITALVEGLRAAAAGLRSLAAPSFETFLLGEVDALAELQRVSARGARLQRVTAALASTLQRSAVRVLVVEEVLGELGASRAVLRITSDEGDDGEDEPVRLACSSGQPVWVESREERDARFPDLAAREPEMAAGCAIPLRGATSVVGVLRLAFAEPRLFSPDERAFLSALAAVAAQALERADLLDAQRRAADRLRQLQALTSALGETHSVEEVLEVALEHGTHLLGAGAASISLLREDGRTLEVAAARPPAAEAVFGVDDPVPAAEAVRTGAYVDVDVDMDVDSRDRHPRSPATPPSGRLSAIPLQSGGVPLGALTLSFPVLEAAPTREYLTAFADACAQALRRARAAEAAGGALRRLAFLADASAELAGALDIETTLTNVARLAVPELADYCVVHLLQDGELACVALEHVDGEQRDRAVDLQRRWPERLDAPGVGAVVRSGAPLLVPSLGQAQAAAPAPELDAEHAAAVAQLGLRSVLIVALTARGRTLGALTLLRVGKREYGPADLAFVQDLAGRAAMAVDNARLHAVVQPPAPADPASADTSVLVDPARPEALPPHADDPAAD